MRIGYKTIEDYQKEGDELALDESEIENLNPMERAKLDRWDKIPVKVAPPELKRGGSYTAPSWGFHFICADCADKYGQYNGTGATQYRKCGWCGKDRMCKCPTSCGWPDNIKMPPNNEPKFELGGFTIK